MNNSNNNNNNNNSGIKDMFLAFIVGQEEVEEDNVIVA
jgi:hypothetical protein